MVLLTGRIMDCTGRVGDSTVRCASLVACLSPDVAFPCQEPTLAVREQDRSLLVVVQGLVDFMSSSAVIARVRRLILGVVVVLASLSQLSLCSRLCRQEIN